MAVKVAQEWLNACSGCEISIVDMGERLLDVLGLIEFVHSPVLMDHKYFGQLGDGKHLDIPEAVVGIVSGGLRNEEHLEVLEEMRKKCQIIIALGTCATHGGIPALANSFRNEEIMERYYSTDTTDKPLATPADGVPPLLDSCLALDEKVKVDVYLPGCPPIPTKSSPLSLRSSKASRLICPRKASVISARQPAKGKGRSSSCAVFSMPRGTNLRTSRWIRCNASLSRECCAWGRSQGADAVETVSRRGAFPQGCRAGAAMGR